MKNKNEQGFVGTDITVAIILVLLFVSITSVLFYNLTKASKGIERESQATYIATEVIEAVKLIEYANLSNTQAAGQTPVQALLTKTGNNWGYTGTSGNVNLGPNISLEAGYSCYVTVENFVPVAHQGDANTDYIKLVTVQVLYKLSNEPQSVTLRTAVLREV